MSKTYRDIPSYKWIRKPKYRHKLLCGESRKQIVTDWDDKHIAALDEIPAKQLQERLDN